MDETFLMPFSSLETDKRLVGINAMVSKILCERHNNNLSELDMFARDFFLYSRECYSHATRKSLSRKRLVLLASGDALELWCIKTLFGLFNAKLMTHGGLALKDSAVADGRLFRTALEKRAFAAPLGMYVLPTAGDFDGELAWAPLSLEDKSKVIGIVLRILGLEIHCIFDSENVNFLYISDKYYYRPSAINVIGKRRNSTMLLTWKDGSRNKSVNIHIHKYQPSQKTSGLR